MLRFMGSQRVRHMPLELLRGSQAPRRAVCGTRGSLRTMHGGVIAPSFCTFPHRVAFEEGSGPRVLLKSGPGNRLGSPIFPSGCEGKLGVALESLQGKIDLI